MTKELGQVANSDFWVSWLSCFTAVASPPTSEEGKQGLAAGNQEKRTTGGHSNGGGGGVPKEDAHRVDSARCIELISQAGGGKQCPEVNQGLTLRAAVKNSDTSRLDSSNLGFVQMKGSRGYTHVIDRRRSHAQRSNSKLNSICAAQH